MSEIKERKLNEPSELAKASQEVNSLPEEELNAPIEELDNEMRERENILDYNLEHISFKGYSQDEINRKIAKAEKEERYYKGMVEHELSMAKHSTDNAGREYHTSKASSFAKEAAKWHEEAIKWKYTKPDKK